MLAEFSAYLVDTIFSLGYVGIFLLMAVESSFIPFPSEVVVVPAGFLVHKGDMNGFFVLLSAIGGSLLGAYINYALALFLGRGFLEKYGNYFFISHESLEKLDTFFATHGVISTLTGRLIPGIRQLISIPAGLSKMDIKLFSIYTAIGSGAWSLVLLLLGYFIGENQELLQTYLHEITLGVVLCVFVIIGVYVFRYKTKHKNG